MLAGASATGLGAVVLGSNEATAEIAVGELAVADGVHEADDPDVSPAVDVTAELAYQVDSLTHVEIRLAVGPSDSDPTVLDSETIETGIESTNTDRDLTGALADADGFDAESFDPDAEETVTHDVTVRLDLEIRDEDEIVAEAEAVDTATVSVTNTSVAIEAGVGGDGDIRFE